MLETSPDTARDAQFNLVVDEYGRFLSNAIAQLCPKDLGIQFSDIEQDAKLRLWRALESEREIRDLASYIYRIAATATIDAVRRVKARREEQLCVAGEDEENGLQLETAKENAPDRLAELVAAGRRRHVGRLDGVFPGGLRRRSLPARPALPRPSGVLPPVAAGSRRRPADGHPCAVADCHRDGSRLDRFGASGQPSNECTSPHRALRTADGRADRTDGRAGRSASCAATASVQLGRWRADCRR